MVTLDDGLSKYSFSGFQVKMRKETEINEMDGKLHEEYENRLQQALEELRDVYDKQMQQSREDFAKLYDDRVRHSSFIVNRVRQYNLKISSMMTG